MGLKKGDRAPEFTLYDSAKQPRSLREFLGKKTVLAFYPGAFTGVCTKEVCTLRDALATLGALNAQVVGVSGDSPFANKAFAEQNKLPFPLLSDFALSVSKQYGGVTEDFSGVKGYVAARRSVFIVDEEGRIQYEWLAASPGMEPPYDDIKKALEAS